MHKLQYKKKIRKKKKKKTMSCVKLTACRLCPFPLAD